MTRKRPSGKTTKVATKRLAAPQKPAPNFPPRFDVSNVKLKGGVPKDWATER